jgi:hypothetical protein
MPSLSSLGRGPIEPLLARLPGGLDLETSARAHGAFVRARRLKSGRELLHLALTYGTGALSLRDTAAWATLNGAAMSDVAVLERLRSPAVGAWLQTLLGEILAARRAAAVETPAADGAAAPGWRVRILDATVIRGPGGRGEHRLHASYDLAGQRLVALDLTDGRGSESLSRFAIGRGEIALADRAYLKARDLQAVRAAGGHIVVRTGWNAARWRTLEDEPFDLFGLLERVAWGEQAEAAILIRPERRRRDRFRARLVVRRLDPAAAKAARDRARRAASKDQRHLQPQTLKAAEFVLLVTSLDAAAFPTGDILELYRRRWQIELAFKRMKSLFGLDRLPAKDPDLARTWLSAKLIAHLLAEDLTQEVLAVSPSGPGAAGPPRLDLAGPENAGARDLC